MHICLLAQPLYTSFVSQGGKNCRAFWRSILNLSHSFSEQILSFWTWYTFPSRKISQILIVLLLAWPPPFLPPFFLSGEDQAVRAASVPWETPHPHPSPLFVGSVA